MQVEILKQTLKTYDATIEEIFTSGDLSLLDKPKVAIVGSRKPSAYTRQAVSNLAAQLSNAGAVVISGGAMGTDCIAHEFSYPNTIAVFANSLDIIYPKICAKILERVRKDALAISKYPPQTPAQKYSFLERNKLVVGLSDAVVVAQGDKNSGSMSSARFAIKTKKPLFVLPHELGKSNGTNELLKKGLARAIFDITEFAASFGAKKAQGDLGVDGANAPGLAALSGRFVSELSAQDKAKILELELEGRVKIQNNRVVIL